MYVGGTGGVAKWTGSSWTYLGSLTSGSVSCLAFYNGALYAGGNLPSNSNIVKWSGTAWNTLSTGTNGQVNALCVYNNKLVVAGSFSFSGGVMTFGFANWDGASWSNFGLGYPYNPSGTGVLTMQVMNDKLYAAGSSLSLMLVAPYACIASYNGSAWADETAGADLSMASVYSLAMHNGELYAGGSFTGVANRVAKWNGSGFVPVGTGMDSTVFALISYKNELYAGGAFTKADGNTARYIAKWNSTNWTEVDNGMGVVVNQPFVFSLINLDDCMVAGGQFTKAGGIADANIARLCSSATDIAPIPKQNKTTIYPNPFSSSTTLQTDIILRNVTLTIYNSFGKEIKQILNIWGQTVSIHRDNLPSGVYFIRLTQDDKTITTGKLIITNN